MIQDIAPRRQSHILISLSDFILHRKSCTGVLLGYPDLYSAREGLDDELLSMSGIAVRHEAVFYYSGTHRDSLLADLGIDFRFTDKVECPPDMRSVDIEHLAERLALFLSNRDKTSHINRFMLKIIYLCVQL